LRESGWPQLNLEKNDFARGNRLELTATSGKAFMSDSVKLPPKVRNAFINMKLANARKAGTISNQKSAAATAWLTLNAASDFRAFGMAWTGYYSVLSSNIFS